MPPKFIEIDLDNDQKAAILTYADFLILEAITRKDLANKRKKWIRFKPYDVTQIIGELAHHFNRSKSDDLFYFLDELICHLEAYES